MVPESWAAAAVAANVLMKLASSVSLFAASVHLIMQTRSVAAQQGHQYSADTAI